MGFGVGRHMCIGNQLARGELRMAFKALLDRMDHLRASRDAQGYPYTPSVYIAYGLTMLWINFDKR
jgi:cytochrome P450